MGSIVFGMEDGTVSIFGLVFGVAAAAPDSRTVLLAGGTGAIAAAVSMMAGTFLDVESTNDQAAARAAEQRSGYEADPDQEDQALRGRLVAAGFSDPEAVTVTGIISRHPDARLKLAAAIDPGAQDTTRQNPVVQSLWMFVTDLFAAAVPVIPFALFSLATARIVSLSVTFVLLVCLGIGRSVIGRRWSCRRSPRPSGSPRRPPSPGSRSAGSSHNRSSSEATGEGMRDWRGTSDRVFYVTVNGTHTPKLHEAWVEKADEIRIVVRSAASSSDEIIGNAAELRCLHHPEGFVVVKGHGFI